MRRATIKFDPIRTGRFITELHFTMEDLISKQILEAVPDAEYDGEPDIYGIEENLGPKNAPGAVLDAEYKGNEPDIYSLLLEMKRQVEVLNRKIDAVTRLLCSK